MPSRPDLREIASNVKEAFAEMDRDTLLEILTFVIKEYVVEGPPPMLVHQAETLADLHGASFAQVITALQTRFDHPELAMFIVDGEQVSVRVGGVVQPLVGTRQPLQIADTRPMPGVRVVETTLHQRPAVPPGGAPPPARGVSLSGRAQVEGPAPEPAPPQAPTPAPPAAAPQPTDKPDATGGDDASARFSLLELD
jgi:hypothetical protein